VSFEARRVRLSVPRDTASLGPVRAVTVELARQLGFAATDVDKIEMAVDEACANAVLYQRGAARAFDISLEATDGALVATVLDGGLAFDFEGATAPGLANRLACCEFGGLGLQIIQRFMDEVTYEHRDGAGNVLTMTKFLPDGPNSAN
jgi:serine/threonine-protein kinase RsbW